MKTLYDTLRTLEITTSRAVTEIFAGNYRSSFQGSGIEVEDLRPYETNDNARLIDWTVTAKLGEPYVKKFKETRELSTFIIIDVSPSMLFSSIRGIKKSDKAIETAAILMFSAMKNGEAVGAILFAGETELFIPPRKGRRHVLRILREIVLAYKKNIYKKSNLASALKKFNKTIKKHPICFVISDQTDWDAETAKALSITNLKNDLVYIHVEDPFEKTINSSENIVLYDMEKARHNTFLLSNKTLQTRYEALRRQKTITRQQTLRKLHIDNLVITTDGLVFPILLTFFKHRQKNPRRA